MTNSKYDDKTWAAIKRAVPNLPAHRTMLDVSEAVLSAWNDRVESVPAETAAVLARYVHNAFCENRTKGSVGS